MMRRIDCCAGLIGQSGFTPSRRRFDANAFSPGAHLARAEENQTSGTGVPPGVPPVRNRRQATYVLAVHSAAPPRALDCPSSADKLSPSVKNGWVVALVSRTDPVVFTTHK